MAAKTSTWIGGTAVAAVAVIAGTWFVVISPTLDSASDTRLQTETTESQNLILEAKISKLESDFGNLTQYQKDLDALRVGIPSSLEIADYLRRLDAIAVPYGLTLTSISPSTPVLVAAAAGVAAPAAVEPTDEATADATGSSDTADAAAAPDTAAAAPVAPAAPAGMIAVPVSITGVGNFVAALAFLHDLQSTDNRLFLVSGMTGTGQAEAEASQGRPATAEGDIELTITGYIYVLPDQGVASEEPGDGTAALPADDGKNPMGSSS